MTNCISRRLLRPPRCWTSWRRLRPKSARSCPRFFPFCRTRFKYRMTIQTTGRSLPSFHFFDTGIAGNLFGAACARSELCSFCYAEKHCQFCYYKAKCFNPPTPCAATRRREWGNVQGRRFFFAVCLRNTFSLADTPHSGASALFVPVRCALIFASQCPTPQSGVGHWRESGGSSREDKSNSEIGCHIAQGRLPLF